MSERLHAKHWAHFPKYIDPIASKLEDRQNLVEFAKKKKNKIKNVEKQRGSVRRAKFPYMNVSNCITPLQIINFVLLIFV